MKSQYYANYVDPSSNSLKIRFAGAYISANLETDSAGDFGFSLRAELPQNSKKVLGQVLLLLTPKGTLALGIGSLQTDKIPYSLTSTADASLQTQPAQEPHSRDDGTLRFYFSFCFACFMIFPVLYAFLGGYYLRRQVALQTYLRQQSPTGKAPGARVEKPDFLGDILDQEGELL